MQAMCIIMTQCRQYLCQYGLLLYRRAVNNTCKMLMALGIGKRNVYEDDFETPFLKESREFFRVSQLEHTYVHTCIYMYNVHVRIYFVVSYVQYNV